MWVAVDRMPRQLVCMGLNSVQKWSAVKGTNFPNWGIITGGMNCVLHEPITFSVRFDVLKIKYGGVQAGMSKLGLVCALKGLICIKTLSNWKQ